MSPEACRIGTAGWSIPEPSGGDFPREGSGLSRYAARLNAVEINTTFYRFHKGATFATWAAAVPEDFRFAVKVPRLFTHFRRLGPSPEWPGFLADASRLGPKLGPLLVQLPPSLPFQGGTAGPFFARLRDIFDGRVVCEPRHATWFGPEAEALLRSFSVARAAADPAVVPEASAPGGWDGLRYFRLHGSPQKYESPYEAPFLESLAEGLRSTAVPAWVIFDNTAWGAATGNALELRARLGA